MAQEVGTFLRTVLRSGLLNREQLQTALRALPRECRQNPQELANHLIQQGQLSRFQAHKLLQGAILGLLLGPYQVQTPIGRGGMGTVYLALDTRSRQHLALKVLPPKKARQEERYLARFRREMEMSQRVRHPNLALTYEVGVSQGVYYIAMEYIPGLSLHRLVAKGGPLPVSLAAPLFCEICSALDHAHSLGLIHRDLKPSNIMVTPHNHAKVLDLGLALMEGEVAEEQEVIGGQGYVVGSMDYIAPEQTEDSTGVDARADIYGLGCALYYALSGRPPFPGGSASDKIRRHRQEEPEPITRLNTAVPEQFAVLLGKMMAKKPEQRYASAYEVREALLAWALGAPELPMDQQGDQAFQEAILALEKADLPAEIGDVVIVKAENVPEKKLSADETILIDEQEGRRDFLWIVLGLVGFWLVILLALAVVALWR